MILPEGAGWQPQVRGMGVRIVPCPNPKLCDLVLYVLPVVQRDNGGY